MPKLELNSQKNIDIFVHQFYKRLLADRQLKHFFKEIVFQNKLDAHLEIIANFWSDILLESNSYGRNAMQPHLDLHLKKPFKAAHFKLWLAHFNKTLDQNFYGPNIEIAKTRAQSIATVMQIKMLNLK